jgi:hypothetical protein
MKQQGILFFLLIIGAYTLCSSSAKAAKREVSFKKEDGWTLYGSLGTPATKNRGSCLLIYKCGALG